MAGAPVLRINVEKEAQRFEESSGNGHAHLHTINVRVENPNLNQMAIQDVPMLNSDNIVCSRLKRGELLMVPAPGTLIRLATCCTWWGDLRICTMRSW